MIPRKRPEYRIRPMTREDVAEVAGIERSAFSNPWSPRSFESLVDQDGWQLRVVERRRGGVVAYAAFHVLLDEAELANIAVRRDRRRRGVGRLLLDHVLTEAARLGARRMYLEVRESNRGAAALYESRGFERVGTRRRYYQAPTEDAMVFARALEPPESGVAAQGGGEPQAPAREAGDGA